MRHSACSSIPNPTPAAGLAWVVAAAAFCFLGGVCGIAFGQPASSPQKSATRFRPPIRNRSVPRDATRGRWRATRRVSVKQTSAVVSGGSPVCETCRSDACSCRRPEFWIISSRRCPQSGGRTCLPRCCFDQFHYCDGRCVRQRDPHAFQRWLQPGAPICVVVHGSFTSFKGLLRESCAMHRWLTGPCPHRPLNIVVFTWPSDDYPTGLFPIDITVLGRRSAFNGLYLAQFLNTLPLHSRVSLIGHSHGARTVAAALHLLSGGTVQGRRFCRPQPCRGRFRTVFLAAAIDHDWLNPGERYGRALCGIEALLNLRNRRDLPLKFYPLRKPFGSRALARSGFTRRDRRKLGRRMFKIAELDVTRYIGRHHMWIHYFQRRQISRAITPYVYFTDDDARRPVPVPAASSQTRWMTSRQAASTSGSTAAAIRGVSRGR